MGERLVTVEIEKTEDGLYRATSHDMEGLFIHGNSPEELRDVLPAALRAMHRAVGASVAVNLVEDVRQMRFVVSAA